MRLFDKLCKQLKLYLNQKQMADIERAFVFADRVHKNQMRINGEPYIIHPLAVAIILATMRLDSETIIAGLLHDVVEDTEVEQAFIEAHFGRKVAELVDGASKLTKINMANKTEAQAENMCKMLLAMAKDIRVILIKIADRLHNMRTIAMLREDKRWRIAKETLEIYIPIAKRLGLYNISQELENLCFQTIYPKRYASLVKALNGLQKRRKSIVNAIQKAVVGTLIKQGFKHFKVTGREKHLYGIYQKMRLKRTSLTKIMDICALRIIVRTTEDCYRVLGFVHLLYRPVAERFKDYIAIPKANGYQSLHTNLFGPYGVPIEIQIRTYAMNTIAEHGIAAHWRYKKQYANDRLADKRTHFWLQSLLTLQRQANSSSEFIENVKLDLFSNEIYVFTPRGDIVELPESASVIDFAYDVHSEIGNHCTAGRINGQLVPLNTQLHSGQTVEVVTSSNTKPDLWWLNFVVTGKARSSISHFLKKRHRHEAIALGRQLLDSVIKTDNTGRSADNRAQKLQRVLVVTRFNTLEELYFKIGTGHHTLLLIAKCLMKPVQQPLSTLEVSQCLSIKEVENVCLHFAKCCYPIPGDPILGLLEKGRGIMVHTTACQNAVAASQEPGKYLPLSWDPGIDSLFFVDLRIAICPGRGVLAEVLMQLSAMVDIEDFKILTKALDRVLLKTIIAVENRQHLASLLYKLSLNKAVISVKRHSGSSNHILPAY